MRVDRGTVLVTGANGYIASCTIYELLQAGYAVRGTVRSPHLADRLRARLRTWSDDGLLEIVHVPDITIPGAFDNAVQAVAHIAAPISSTFTDPSPILATAVQSTTGLLDSCVSAAGPNLKSFILMSSATTMIPKGLYAHLITEADWENWAEDEIAALGPRASASSIYVASKTASERAMWRFRNERGPPFSMTSINPGFVCGPPLVLPDDPNQLSETAGIVWDVFHGQKVKPAFQGIWPYVDIHDVARLIIWAIDHPALLDKERYLAVATEASPLNIAELLLRGYPGRRDIIRGPWSGANDSSEQPVPGRTVGFDASKAVKATGKPWISFDRTVLEAAKDFEVYL
ncbi:NAD(P)-binding protein [Aspergillus affinis]|uniref:NAD(P)-binding protein n=1 Tax=Aspergillus affinis TaxID=1070780 RepID=UPI0022FDFDB4|nr:NAD(P)-binding protein [Aspergillus affinis]KAI9037920.1 NAD(P)-binding protein [Aspergillus affinis]